MTIAALIVSIAALVIGLRAAGYARQLRAYWYQMMRQTLEEISTLSIDEIMQQESRRDK